MTTSGISNVTFVAGVPVEKVLSRLAAAPGKELESGKLASKESSAALAVNAFGWFIERPGMLPQLPGCPQWGTVEEVDIEYCARFPWPGGRHPWLDAVVRTPSHLIGVESKRFEPFRDKKNVALSDAYDRPVWGDSMGPVETMRDALRANPVLFQTLDAAQLVKHAFGLVTQARLKNRQPHLHYLYAEPSSRAGRAISKEIHDQHRREIDMFARAVAGAEVRFSACSYQQWLATWPDEELGGHAQRLQEAFEL